MPIYEYICQSCGTKFEKLVLSASSANSIACPECESTAVEKAFSVFGMARSSGQGGAAASASSCATGST